MSVEEVIDSLRTVFTAGTSTLQPQRGVRGWWVGVCSSECRRVKIEERRVGKEGLDSVEEAGDR